jgi:hypothetical protein
VPCSAKVSVISAPQVLHIVLDGVGSTTTGCGVGSGVGCGVGSGVGCGVGAGVGSGVGCGVGAGVGCAGGSGACCGAGVGVGCGAVCCVGFGVAVGVGVDTAVAVVIVTVLLCVGNDCGVSVSLFGGCPTLSDSVGVFTMGTEVGDGSSISIIAVSSVTISSMYASSTDITASSCVYGSIAVCPPAHPDTSKAINPSIKTAITCFFMALASFRFLPLVYSYILRKTKVRLPFYALIFACSADKETRPIR